MKLLYYATALATIVHAQSSLFLEQWYEYDWLQENPYDRDNSECASDNDCVGKPGIPEGHSKCALFEYLDVTSVQVTQFVQFSRTKNCMRPEECGKQLTHQFSGYRILTFCGAAMEDRLGAGLFMAGASYYNLGISDAQCIKDQIGKPCKYRQGKTEKEGICVMLNTDRMLKKDLVNSQMINRETLHSICLVDEDGLKRNNYEMRMLWGDPIVYCDKTTKLISKTIPLKTKKKYKSLKDFQNAKQAQIEEQFKQKGNPCPVHGIATRISYVSDQVESDVLTVAVQHYYEAEDLKKFFYFPAIVDIIMIVFCGASMLLIFIVDQFIRQAKKKKRGRRLKDWGNDKSDKTTLDQVRWPNAKKEAEQAGWSLNDYNKEWEAIKLLGEDSKERLERFANLFTRSLDLIVVALASKRTIPHDVIKNVRDQFAEEIQVHEMPVIQNKVMRLTRATVDDKFLDEPLDEEETKKVEELKSFFQSEEKVTQAVPQKDLKDLKNFKSSALYQDKVGRRLFNCDQYSLALFIRMYIHERFSAYKEAISVQFKGKKWEVKNDFQKNAVKIWQNYTDYRQPGLVDAYRRWMIRIVKATCQVVVIVTLAATLVPLIFFEPHYKEQVGRSFFPWIIMPLLISILIWYIMNKLEYRKEIDLSRVNDLVQGSIEAPIGELQEAYRHFAAMPTIEILNIQEDLHDLQRVRVNFEYDQAFVGEMDFRFRRWDENYHAKIFLREISNAARPIEVLQTLNYMEIFMSLNRQLTHHHVQEGTGAQLPEEKPCCSEASESLDPEKIMLDVDNGRFSNASGKAQVKVNDVDKVENNYQSENDPNFNSRMHLISGANNASNRGLLSQGESQMGLIQRLGEQHITATQITRKSVKTTTNIQSQIQQ